MMKQLKALFLAFAVTVVGAGALAPEPARASGIPTVDLANLAQSLTDYISQLEQYAEQLSQTALNQSQLAELINQYQQALTSYEQVLRQMQGLKEKLSPQEWEAVMNQYGRIFDLSPVSIESLDPEDLQRAREQVGQTYYQADARGSANVIDGLYSGDSRTAAHEIYGERQALANQGITQQVAVNAYQQELMRRQDQLQEIDEKRFALGDSDELATMQLMAEQNSVVLGTLQQMVAVSTSQLQNANKLEQQYNAGLIRATDESLQRAKRKAAEQPTVNEAPLRSF